MRSLVEIVFAILDEYGVIFVNCLVDEVEWTDPEYYHQN